MIDVLMATLGEYDALWDGELFPEIVDAECYDCPIRPIHTLGKLPLMSTPPIFRQTLDRWEALTTLLATVGELATRCPEELCSEGVDAVLTDCSTIDELQLLYPNIAVLLE